MKPRAVFLSAFIVAIALSPAASGAQRFGSTISIHLSSYAYFYGLVSSHEKRCESHRELKIVRRPSGGGDFTTYATGITSNGDGTWIYDPGAPLDSGLYKAVAPSKDVHGAVCTREESRALSVN